MNALFLVLVFSKQKHLFTLKYCHDATSLY